MLRLLPLLALIFALASSRPADGQTSSTAAAVSHWFELAAELVDDEALAEPHDVQLQGDLAYIPGKGGSIAIVDVAEPAMPQLIWHRCDPDALPNIETVLPLGKYLLLGARDFHWLDVSDPANPSLVQTISDRDRIDHLNGLVKRGNYIFAAAKTGWIDVFDVSDLTAPTILTALDVRHTHGLKKPHDIDFLDQYVVIVDSQDFAGPVGKLAIFKAFNCAGQLLADDQWECVGTVEAAELIGANRLQVSGRYAFVCGSWMPEARAELSHEVSAKFSVVDLANPAVPAVVASLPFSDLRGPNGLTIAGKVAFVAGGQTIEAVDISNPRQPVQIGTQKINTLPPGADNLHDLVYRDGYLFVSCQSENRFAILKITDQRILKLAEP